MSDELPILTKAAGGCYLGKYDLHQLTSVELQRLLDNAAAVSAADNARLHAAIRHYEAALKEVWPEGAKGKSFEHWNSARIAIHGSQP